MLVSLFWRRLSDSDDNDTSVLNICNMRRREHAMYLTDSRHKISGRYQLDRHNNTQCRYVWLFRDIACLKLFSSSAPAPLVLVTCYVQRSVTSARAASTWHLTLHNTEAVPDRGWPSAHHDIDRQVQIYSHGLKFIFCFALLVDHKRLWSPGKKSGEKRGVVWLF